MTAKKKNVKVSKGQKAVDEQVRKYAETRQEVLQSLKSIEQDVVAQTAQQLGIKPEAIPNELRFAEKVFDRLVPQLPFGEEDKDKELEQLRAWKKSALALEATWDEQAIGRELGIGLGQSIRDKILPAIKNMRVRVVEDFLQFLEVKKLHVSDYDGFMNQERVQQVMDEWKQGEGR